MINLPELLRLLNNLIRIGTVHAVTYDPPRCRVKCGDLLSAWIPWLSTRAGETSDWNPPSAGEQVILLSPGGDTASAIALCGLFSNQNPAPYSNPDTVVRKFKDNAVFRYNHKRSELTIELPGNATVKAEGGLNLIADIAIDGNLQVSGNTTFDGDSVEHQGKEIGKSHKHLINSGSSAPGPTGEVQ